MRFPKVGPRSHTVEFFKITISHYLLLLLGDIFSLKFVQWLNTGL